jgi:ATPase family associated with various cellular activities (AAA).
VNRRKRSGRTRVHPSPARLLLLTGIPATGKTRIGNRLSESYGFNHLDFEDPTTLDTYLGQGEAGLRRAVKELKKTGHDVVITWGFLPDVQLAFVRVLRSLGFTWVWFDGNRAAARREYLWVGRVEAALDRQMERIQANIDPHMTRLAPAVVNPFDDTSQFREPDEIVTELLALLIRGESTGSVR